MRKRENLEKRFLADAKDHKLTVLCDQGVDRSLLFKTPGSSYHYFRITTWEGHLCISGDMGTFVFQRNSDMFSFFKVDKDDWAYKKRKKLNINISYWHEKLVSEDTQGGSREYSEDLLLSHIKSMLNIYCQDNEVPRGFKTQCWNTIKEQFSGYSHEYEVRESVGDKCWADTKEQEEFADYLEVDFWEVRLKDYTLRFIWCLYAIVWGIKQYEAFKKKDNEINT